MLFILILEFSGAIKKLVISKIFDSSVVFQGISRKSFRFMKKSVY